MNTWSIEAIIEQELALLNLEWDRGLMTAADYNQAVDDLMEWAEQESYTLNNYGNYIETRISN